MQPITPEVVRDIVDSNEEREFWTVVREHERPPFFFENEGVGNRLNRASRVVTDGRITPNSDGSFTVEGSEGRTYRVTNSCSCPQSQKGKSKVCYHYVAVCLYVEWQKRIHPSAPVVLGTLRPGTLPLPPVTVDERLAQAVTDAQARAGALDAYDVTQEELMASEDEEVYIPEPDAPQAILEPAERKEEREESPRALPGPVLLPSLDAQSLQRSMQEWSAQRKVIRSFLQQELKEGVDFYRLQVRGKDANPTLSKAGAEKFLGLFQLQASFAPDLLTWEMLGKPTDHVIYICTLRTRSGEIVGEGRGSRSLKKDSGDTNKAIKMSEKSALIDAVLRTGALSEVYTQDAEDLQEEHTPAPVKPTPLHPAAELRQRIWARVQALAPEATTREAVTRVIMERTGLALHPDHYGEILAHLTAQEG